VRVLLSMENGREEDRSREAQTTHAGADRQEAQGGRPDAGRGHGDPEVCKALEVSEATYHRWRAQYGGMKADDVKRLKELERENGQLKRLAADKELENLALKELAKGNF
jgi:putative transposase